MKNYEDIAERVFRKGDAILDKKRRKTAIIKRTSFAVSGLCAVVITGFGLWNNYYLKNALNNEPPAIIDSQNVDTPVMTQTTAFSAVKSSNALSVTVSTAGTSGNPDVFSSAMEVSENMFTDYNSDVTATYDEFFPVSASTRSEYLQKITETSASTAVQTSASTTVQTSVNTTAQTSVNTTTQTSVNTTTQNYLIVTVTTNPPQNIDDERSLHMKKLMSIMSAITLSLSAMPTISNASGVPFSVNPVRYWPGENKIFAEMESGELDVDINGNGEFDIMDCYLLDAYDSQYYSYRENIDPEIIQRIESIADYDRNGVVDFDDTLHLMRYFIVAGNIRAEYLDPAYYDPDIEPLTTEDDLINFGKYKEIQAYVFPMRMYYNVHYLDAEYYLVEDLYENGKIDLDINGNGQLDIFDAYCINVYFHDNKDRETVTQFLTEEEYERCRDFTYHYSEPLVPHHCSDFTKVAAMAYILNHIELKPEYFTIAFYKKNVDNYSIDHCTAGVMKHSASNIGIEVSGNIGPSTDIEYDRKHFLHMDKFTPYYEEFCADIENGVRPVPDVNLDGVVDYYDYFDMSIYWDSSNSAEKSILPMKTWNTINEYYDIPGDDKPTLYEISSAQLYIIEHNEELADIDSVYNDYIQSLIEANENGEKDDFEPINNQDIHILDVDAKRSGDANEDGEVNMADAVLIMQSLSNPSEYKLTERGKFNADICDTGDGVTARDALQIQLWAINAGDLI